MNATDQRRIAAEIDLLRRLHRATHKGRPALLPEGSVTKLDVVEQRLLDAIRRDATGDTRRDGYPTGQVGNGGEDAPQSSTEAAALAGFDSDGHPRDPEHDAHHALTTAATAALAAAADAVAVLIMKLDAIDRLATIHRTDPAGFCNACSRWVEGTAVDRLRSGYCDACRKAWEREGKPDRMQFERRRAAAVPTSAAS